MIEELKAMLEREKELLTNPYLLPDKHRAGYLVAISVIQRWIADKEAAQKDTTNER